MTPTYPPNEHEYRGPPILPKNTTLPGARRRGEGTIGTRSHQSYFFKFTKFKSITVLYDIYYLMTHNHCLCHLYILRPGHMQVTILSSVFKDFRGKAPGLPSDYQNPGASDMPAPKEIICWVRPWTLHKIRIHSSLHLLQIHI